MQHFLPFFQIKNGNPARIISYKYRSSYWILSFPPLHSPPLSSPPLWRRRVPQGSFHTVYSLTTKSASGELLHFLFVVGFALNIDSDLWEKAPKTAILSSTNPKTIMLICLILSQRRTLPFTNFTGTLAALVVDTLVGLYYCFEDYLSALVSLFLCFEQRLTQVPFCGEHPQDLLIIRRTGEHENFLFCTKTTHDYHQYHT